MLIIAIKDKLADKFVQFFPTQSIAVAKRDLLNAKKTPNTLFNSNPGDFDVYQVCSIDESTGDVLTTGKSTFVCNLDEITNETEVQ